MTRSIVGPEMDVSCVDARVIAPQPAGSSLRQLRLSVVSYASGSPAAHWIAALLEERGLANGAGVAARAHP